MLAGAGVAAPGLDTPIDERGLAPAARVLLAVALALGAASWLVAEGTLRLLLAVAGLTLALLVLAVSLMARRAQSDAAEARARFADFAGLDGAPCFATDADGAIVYENPAAVARFGLAEGRPMARAMGDLFASPGAVLARLQDRALAAGHAHEDVVTRRGHVRLSVHRVAGGRFFWRMEEFVDRSATTRGAESLGIPMLTVSRTGTVLFLNDAMRRLVGGRVRSLDRIFAYLPIRSGEEVEVVGTDGPVRAIVVEIEEASGRREVYLLPVPPDHPRAQAAFSGFEDLPVALARLSPTGRVLQANRAARELLGIATAQRGPGADTAVADLQLDLSRLVDGLGRPVADWLADAMAGRTENRTETLRATRAGGDTHLQITLRRVVEDARPGLVAVIADATELQALEAQFVQSQKMQAIGQLAGGIAHDFNNLLTAIAGHCDLLLLRRDPGDPDYADLIQVHQNTNRAASLVGQLLAFSRKQRLMPEVLDLRDVLGAMTHLLDRLVGERVTLRFDHDPDLPPIRADKRQVEQVLMNLVVNARDAMPDGGEVRVETDYLNIRHPFRRDRVTVPAGAYVRVRVADTGHGIPPEVLPRIFEPFFTTKRQGQGTGLGLSTVYGIVKQSGGFIFAETTPGTGPGTGTTFLIYLPVDPTDAAGARAEAAEDDGPDSGWQLPPDLRDDWRATPTGLLARGADNGAEATNGQGGRPATAPDGDAPADADVAAADRPVADGDPAQAGVDGSTDSNHTPPAAVARAGDRPQQCATHDSTASHAGAAPSASHGTPRNGTGPQAVVSEPSPPPAARRPAGGPAAPVVMADDPLTARILLVEDEAPVRLFAARALRHKGHEVLEADSAEAALATLEDPGLGVDLVISDVVMPGLDGPTWVRRARKRRPDLPVIFMSGYADAGTDSDDLLLATSTLLPKPFSLDELADLVQRTLHDRDLVAASTDLTAPGAEAIGPEAIGLDAGVSNGSESGPTGDTAVGGIDNAPTSAADLPGDGVDHANASACDLDEHPCPEAPPTPERAGVSRG